MFRKTLRQLQPLGDILRKTTTRANTKDAVQRMLSANMDKFTDAAQAGQGECTVEFDTKKYDPEIFQQVMTSNQLEYKLLTPTKVTVIWSQAEEKKEKKEPFTQRYVQQPAVKATSATIPTKPKLEKKEEVKKVETRKEEPKREEKKEDPILGKKWQRGEDGTYTFQLQ